MNKLINLGIVIAAILIAGVIVLDACGKLPEPTVSTEEAEARLKTAEMERAKELEEMNTTAYTEASKTYTETTVDLTPIAIVETPEYIEEEIKEHIIHTEPYVEEETSTEETTIIEEVEEEITEAVTESNQSSNPYEFTDDEIWEIARITYLENGYVGYYYPTYLTACVIINRYLDWGYNSIEEVIFAQGQYSTAYKYDDWGGGTLVINDLTWQAVYDALADTDRNPHYQMRGGSGNLYYQDPNTGECFYY